MRFNNAVTGIVILGFSIFIIAVAQTFPIAPGEQVGPNVFPALIATGLGICAIFLIVDGILSGVRDVREGRKVKVVDVDRWVRDPGALMTVALIPASVLFYFFASEFLGFIPVSIIIMATLLIRLGRRVLSSLIIAAATTGVIQMVFGNVLLVPLPLGLLEPLIYG